jgi:hypothetical protein
MQQPDSSEPGAPQSLRATRGGSQALGAVPGDGVVAGGHRGWGPVGRRQRGEDRVGDRRPQPLAVCARVVAPATARPVCDALEAALPAHGVQEQLDVWVGHDNHERPHQTMGRVPPIERFWLAAPRPGPAETSEPAVLDIGRPAPTRRVRAKGTISLAMAQYRPGAWLDGQEMEVACDGGLVQLRHRGCAHSHRRGVARPCGRPFAAPGAAAASCVCRRVRRDDPYAIGELVALAWARIRIYPARPNRAVAANLLMDVRKQFAQGRLVGGGGVDTVGLPLERADDVPPLEREAIAPSLPTGYRSGAG